MKVLIVYATNSGSTHEVACIIESVLSGTHSVVKQKAAESKPEDLQKYDVVLFGSPSWKVNGQEGQIQETMQEFLGACAGTISPKLKFAAFGCGDPEFTFFCQAVDTMAQILKKAGAQEVFAPLKIDSFYFHLLENTKQAKHWAQHLQTVLAV